MTYFNHYHFFIFSCAFHLRNGFIRRIIIIHFVNVLLLVVSSHYNFERDLTSVLLLDHVLFHQKQTEVFESMIKESHLSTMRESVTVVSRVK